MLAFSALLSSVSSSSSSSSSSSMAMASRNKSLKFAMLLLISFIALHFYTIPIHALQVGVQANTNPSVSKECSKTCESSFCKVPPFLRYGKYCGLLYSGCPGEKPCDELDACCMKHDACILSKNNDYLSQECNGNLLKCIASFKKAGRRTFAGNTCDVNDVTRVISGVMDAAILAGRFLHKPKAL